MKKVIVVLDIIWGLTLIFVIFVELIIGCSEHDAFYISMAVLFYLMLIRHLHTLDDDLKDMRESEVKENGE